MGSVRWLVAGSVLWLIVLAAACGDGGGDTIIIINAGGAGGAANGGGENSGGEASGGAASGGAASGGAASGGAASGGAASGGAASGGNASGGNPAGGSGGGPVNVDCTGAPPTRLHGVVRDPSGTLPLFNVAVYVPSGPLTALTDGATGCARCANWNVPASALTMTSTTGEFTLEGVPAGNVPLVIETGKWRREVTVPNVTACDDNEVDAGLTRLPRNKTEGHIPKIAVVRGGSDSLECLVHALGIDNDEFTTDAAAGRVHLYYSSEGSATAETGQLVGGVALPASTALYSNLDKMKGYDLVMLGCSGSDAEVEDRPPAQVANMRDYAAAGGRLLGSHFHVMLIDPDQYGIPYPTIVSFASGQHGSAGSTVGVVNATFLRGAAFNSWLDVVGASSPSGQFQLQMPEHNVNSVTHSNARAWVTTNDDAGHTNVPEYFSFPTPIDGPVCGRMAFTSLHVGNGSTDSGKVAFPNGCSTTAATMTAQQKAFAFWFFDLTGCVEAQEGSITAPTAP